MNLAELLKRLMFFDAPTDGGGGGGDITPEASSDIQQTTGEPQPANNSEGDTKQSKAERDFSRLTSVVSSLQAKNAELLKQQASLKEQLSATTPDVKSKHPALADCEVTPEGNIIIGDDEFAPDDEVIKQKIQLWEQGQIVQKQNNFLQEKENARIAEIRQQHYNDWMTEISTHAKNLRNEAIPNLPDELGGFMDSVITTALQNISYSKGISPDNMDGIVGLDAVIDDAGKKIADNLRKVIAHYSDEQYTTNKEHQSGLPIKDVQTPGVPGKKTLTRAELEEHARQSAIAAEKMRAK